MKDLIDFSRDNSVGPVGKHSTLIISISHPIIRDDTKTDHHCRSILQIVYTSFLEEAMGVAAPCFETHK